MDVALSRARAARTRSRDPWLAGARRGGARASCIPRGRDDWVALRATRRRAQPGACSRATGASLPAAGPAARSCAWSRSPAPARTRTRPTTTSTCSWSRAAAAPGRVCLALTVLSRLLGVRRTLCLNYIVDEAALALPRAATCSPPPRSWGCARWRAARRTGGSCEVNGWACDCFPNFRAPPRGGGRSASPRGRRRAGWSALLDLGPAPLLRAARPPRARRDGCARKARGAAGRRAGAASAEAAHAGPPAASAGLLRARCVRAGLRTTERRSRAATLVGRSAARRPGALVLLVLRRAAEPRTATGSSARRRTAGSRTDGGVHRLLPAERRREMQPFLELYQRVRRDEGWRAERGLPERPARPSARAALAPAGARASGGAGPAARARSAAVALGRARGRRGVLPGPARAWSSGPPRGGRGREPRSRRRPAAPPTACSPRPRGWRAPRRRWTRCRWRRAASTWCSPPASLALRARPAAHAGRAAARHAPGRAAAGPRLAGLPPPPGRRGDGGRRACAALGSAATAAVPRESQSSYLVLGELRGAVRRRGLDARGPRLARPLREGLRDVVEIAAPRPPYRALPDPAGDGAMAEREPPATAPRVRPRGAPRYDEGFGRNPVGLALPARVPGAPAPAVPRGRARARPRLRHRRGRGVPGVAGRARARDRRRAGDGRARRGRRRRSARPGRRAVRRRACARPRTSRRRKAASTAPTRTSARSTAPTLGAVGEGWRARCGRARRCCSA